MANKRQRLSSTITIGSVLEQSVKRNVGFLKTGLSQVGDSIKEVERRQRELDRQRHVLRRQGESVAHLDREYEELERTLAKLRRAQERWNRAAAASRRVGSTFNNMANDISRNARRLAVGVGLAGGAVFGLAASTAKLGDNAAKTADKLGIGIIELQELRYAAERSGVATASFDSSLEKMTKNIGLALEGTGAQKDALDALGLSATDLATMLPEQALANIADRLQGVETQAEKAAIANDIFGRSGIGMLNMLRDGSKGLAQLRVEARRTGFVLSEKAARDAEVFQDTLLDTQLVMKGLRNTVGTALMPVVTKSMKRIGDALIENRDEVEVWAGRFADGVERVIPVLGDIAMGLGEVSMKVGSVISSVAEMVGGWKNFGIIVGAALAGRTLLSIGKFAVAVGQLGSAMLVLSGAGPLVAGAIKAIGVAMVANPIGALVTAIAVGAALIVTNWEKVQPVIQPVLDWLGKALMWAWDNAGKPLIDGLRLGASAIGDAWAALGAAVGPILDGIGEAFLKLYEYIKPVVNGLKWVVEKGQGAAASVGDFFSGERNGQPLGVQPRGKSRSRSKVQTNALGGPFQPGWHLTGERGPELKFENRAGFVADNRAMRQLASYADRVGSFTRARQSAARAASGSDAMTAMAGSRAADQAAPSVTQHVSFTINAPGASAAEIMRLVERKSRQAAGDGLFDRVASSGSFGR